MALDYSNPYRRKSKFEYAYPSTSLSASSLFVPTVSICPKKKYSKETWYDYKSSNPQLSEKVLYRMQAHFSMLQARGYQDQQYEHLDNCLLGCECKKNPFSKPYLLNQSMQEKYGYKNQQEDHHWTEKRGNINFIEPHLYKTSSETLNQFKELKKKQMAHRQKFEISPNVLEKGFKGTFGGSQKTISTLENRQGFLNKKEDLRASEQQIRQQLNLVESQKQLSKHSSDGTFGYRNSFAQLPPTLTYEGRTFFFVKLGIQGK